ncbi:MAG: hypothetical protein K2H02_00810 [Anaeroplasmataceae bacterium]|nr:hypothetical protein [Anaeroplasmataceae bacterium]
MDKELFKIGSFSVTVIILILAIFLLIVIGVAIVAFRKNYILQVKLSRMMDPESNVHNTLGTIAVLKKRRKKIKKACSNVGPALVVVQIDNLGGLYVGYSNRNQLMRDIVTAFRYDLNEQEFVTRLDFNKFCVTMCNRDRNSIRHYVAA